MPSKPKLHRNYIPRVRFRGNTFDISRSFSSEDQNASGEQNNADVTVKKEKSQRSYDRGWVLNRRFAFVAYVALALH